MRLVFSDFKESPHMSLFATASRLIFAILFASTLFTLPAHALDLDWHGQFRAEENVIYGYSNGVAATPNNGYTVPNTGDSPATFQDLFLRLTPRVIVNDNVTLHSDFWLGLPDRSFFGSDGTGQRSYYNTDTGNAAMTAHLLYAEIASDFGTLRVGRMPLNWGLGLVWNSKDNAFDRLPSNGDGFSMNTKFGAFEFTPAVVKYEDGRTDGTTGGLNGTDVSSNSGVSDYTLSLKYKNDDEQIDLGVLFLRRIAGPNANVINPMGISPVNSTTITGSPTTTQYAYNMFDFYATKKAGILNFSAEVPLVSGTIAGTDYSAVSGVVKVSAKTSEHWLFNLNLGNASGQGVGQAGTTPTQFSAFYFHPDYRPGLILFNYNFRNIVTGAGSPYDNPVTNAKFVTLDADYTTGKWSHDFTFIYAIADQVADGVAGNTYFNSGDGHYETEVGGQAQDKGLGFEVDYGLGYQWDESIRFGLDLGLYLPGKYYAFSNSAVANTQSAVFASNLNVMVNF
jgi:hypothetical protein